MVYKIKVLIVTQYFPQLMKHMSTTVSPMAAVARYVRQMEPEAVTVFIGPCIAKKNEVCNVRGMGNAGYALPFEELAAMFGAKKIALEPNVEYEQNTSIYEKRFAKADQRTVGESIKTVTDTFLYGMHRSQS